MAEDPYQSVLTIIFNFISLNDNYTHFDYELHLIDINECHVQPCLNNGACIDGINTFSCNCSSDYSGVTCENGKRFPY